MLQMSESSKHWSAGQEVQASGQVDVALLPERRELVARYSGGRNFYALHSDVLES